MIRKTNIPKFKSEAEEAAWWDEHREETAKWMEYAVAAGKTSTLSGVLERASQRGTTPTVSIRIDPEDIARARSLGAKKGLRYQTYLKMLLHQALQREERIQITSTGSQRVWGLSALSPKLFPKL